MSNYERRVYLARVRDFVDGVSFPATREEILAHARRRNTPSDIYADLTHLPDRRFDSLADVVAAVQELRFASAAR
ncbi:MAG: DUF2795 domain-containing protein [Chloroflexi bacterium]|nr:DUF2795 domain-containing protein [Chloroflexota bacterium]